MTKQITIPVGSNLNQTELILIPFIHCSNSLFLLEVYDTNNELSAPDWAIVDIYQKTVTLDFNSISKSIKSYNKTVKKRRSSLLNFQYDVVSTASAAYSLRSNTLLDPLALSCFVCKFKACFVFEQTDDDFLWSVSTVDGKLNI